MFGQMYAELQVLSPLVPTREAHFLRYCQQNAEEGTWAIVDFPIDSFHDNLQPSFPRYKRRPSGCLIQDMPNGYSRVLYTFFFFTSIHKKEERIFLSNILLLSFLNFIHNTFNLINLFDLADGLFLSHILMVFPMCKPPLIVHDHFCNNTLKKNVNLVVHLSIFFQFHFSVMIFC